MSLGDPVLGSDVAEDCPDSGGGGGGATVTNAAPSAVCVLSNDGTRRPGFAHYVYTNAGAVDSVSFTDGEGAVLTVAATDIVSPGACPIVDTYETAFGTVPASTVFTIPNTGDLVSWAVRHLTGTVTVDVNSAGPEEMTGGEVVQSATPVNGVVGDDVEIVTVADSTARYIYMIRVATPTVP